MRPRRLRLPPWRRHPTRLPSRIVPIRLNPAPAQGFITIHRGPAAATPTCRDQPPRRPRPPQRQTDLHPPRLWPTRRPAPTGHFHRIRHRQRITTPLQARTTARPPVAATVGVADADLEAIRCAFISVKAAKSTTLSHPTPTPGGAASVGKRCRKFAHEDHFPGITVTSAKLSPQLAIGVPARQFV
jgi:hypothetical protein